MNWAHPRSACGASPLRGRHQQSGEAGAAVALDDPQRFATENWNV
jgi:hypothetical protein